MSAAEAASQLCQDLEYLRKNVPHPKKRAKDRLEVKRKNKK